MKLKSLQIENYRAIEQLTLSLDPSLMVLYGPHGQGKTSVLSAIAVVLGAIRELPSDPSECDFTEQDQREDAGPPRVSATDLGGNSWERRGDQRMVQARMNTLADSGHLPIAAFYGADRSVSDLKRPGDPEVEFPRLTALEGALGLTDFQGLFTWFYFKQDEELREQKRRRDFDYQSKDLSAVRQAISSMCPEVYAPRMELNPPRFVVSRRAEQGRVEKLSLEQLGGGSRIVLALAADLARRMAQGNPHLDDPLQAEAIVLIDEVELHLHPGRQQQVLGDLVRTFPNSQFIVSTHSPQVLTTVEPHRILELSHDGDRMVAGTPAGPTFGAEAGDVLSVVMGVDQRPPENPFTRALDQYRHLIREGRWESEEALALRASLEEMSPHDPALDRADLEVRRRTVFRQRAEAR